MTAPTPLDVIEDLLALAEKAGGDVGLAAKLHGSQAVEALARDVVDAARYRGARDSLAQAIANPDEDRQNIVDVLTAWGPPDGEERGPNAAEIDELVDQVLALQE